MSKNKHHYVPRLYLKNFAIETCRINIFQIEKQLAVRSGSLRDQCYKHKMYGKTDELEDILSSMEGKIAPVINSIIAPRKTFYLTTEDMKWLLIFVALQMTRTTAAAEKINEGTDKLFKLMFSEQAKQEGIDLSKVRIGFDNPVFHSMRHFVFIAAALNDLVVQLLVNNTAASFITSDNPVILYNQYCEGIRGIETTGTLARGLQIFVPVSPTRTLLLYDPKVYSVKDRDARITVLTKVDDVKKINLLCAVNADKVLLFSNWDEEQTIRQTVLTARKHRVRDGAIVEEFVSDEDPHKSLVHFSFSSVNIGLNLSFVKLRRRAQQVPIET